MNSISFPNIFKTKSNSTNVVKDDANDMSATFQNLYLLFRSEKGELKCDPFYGIRLKRYMYDQNNYILHDILVDEIYSQIKLFCPQLIVNRNDIKVVADKQVLKLKLKATNRVDFKTDMYELVLFSEEERI